MNTKLLAGIAVFALLAGVVSTSMMQSVYAADYGMKDDSTTKKTETKKVVPKKTVVKAKVEAKKTETKAKVAAKKTETKAKVAAKKTEIKAKVETAREAGSGMATGMAMASDKVTIEMAKGAGSNTSCADKCYTPSDVQVKAGTTVTWKNVDTAAHYATSGKDATSDGLFDSGMVMAGKTFSYKFDKAGTYDYFCMVHPWMTGKVTVS